MSVALKKLDGVESVEVSLEKASAEIRLRAENRVTLERIRQVIRTSGYPTRDADVTARGKVVEQGKPEDVLGNPQHPRTRSFLSRFI